MGILDQLGKFAQKPGVRGALVAGAAGINPLFGLLAAPMIRGNDDKREQIRLQNEAQRTELSDAKRRREAMSQLQGMLGASSVVQGTGTSIRPEGAGMEDQISLDVPGRKARVPMLATGAGRQKALGLLGDASPQTFGGILGKQLFPEQQQQGRLGEQLAAFRQVLGRDPTEEEFLRLTGAGADQGGNLQDDKTRLEIAKIIRDLQGETDSKNEADASRARGIQSRLERADRILGLTNRLEGSGLEPGSFAVESRRPFISFAGEVAGLFGANEFAQARKDELTSFDVLKKETNIFINEMMSQLSEQGDRTTDSKLRQLQNAAATVEVSPGAIRSVMAEAIQTSLDEADRLGISLDGRDQYATLLKRLNTGGRATQDLGGGVTLEFLD